MARRGDLTANLVRELLDYDPETGVLTWRARRDVPGWWNTRFAGREAGVVTKRGYRRVVIGRVSYAAHHIAWLHFYGGYPSETLDHQDHNRGNNSIRNLRIANASANSRNRSLSSANSSGVLGVHWDASRRCWKATIWDGETRHFLGRYQRLDDAASARSAAEKRYGFHPNHGAG